MVWPLKSRSSDYFRYSRGTGPIGVLFALVLTGFTIGFAGQFKDQLLPGLLSVVVWSFTAVPIAIAIVLLLLRTVTVFRGQERTIEQYRWLAIPFRRRVESLDQFWRVECSREVRVTSNSDGDRRTTTVYPVRLVGSGDFDVGEFGSAASARRISESIARVAQLPMVNSSMGDRVRREPHELDMSLRERLLSDGQAPELPDLPDNSLVTVEESGGRLKVQLASPHWIAFHGIFLVMATFALGFAWLFCTPIVDIWQKNPTGLVIGCGAVICTIFLAGLVMTMRQVPQPEVLWISPSEILVRRRGILRIPRRVLIDDLESTVISRSDSHPFDWDSGLKLIGDRQQVHVARGWKADELKRLEKVIQHAICR